MDKDRKKQRSEALKGLKKIAGEVTDGFVELMDKTRSHLDELDPLGMLDQCNFLKLKYKQNSNKIILRINLINLVYKYFALLSSKGCSKK